MSQNKRKCIDCFFEDAYNRILPIFIDEFSHSGGGLEGLFSASSRLFNSILELSDIPSAFAVLMYGGTDFNNKMETRYYDSVFTYREAFEPVLQATVDLLANQPENTVKILSGFDLGLDSDVVANIPHSTLVLPMHSGNALLGYILVYFHQEPPHSANDELKMKFITKIMYMISLIYQSELIKSSYEQYFMNDYLTDLPNRDHIYESIIYALQTADVFDTRFALLIVRVNGLKSINNSLGIVTGDLMLKEMGMLVKASASGGEGYNVLVGRLSGGDFAVVITLPAEDRDENDDRYAVDKCCATIIKNTGNPMEINGYKLYPSVNIGASIYPYHGETAEEMLRKADLAKNSARHSGPHSYKIYENYMGGDAEKVLFLNNNLPAAIAENQFELFYQAQVDIKTGTVSTAEALIRWRHPERGLIFPGDFIAFAESNDYGIKIDLLVLEMACDQINEWRKGGIGDFTISVNISPKHFANGLIFDSVSKVLAAKGVEPSCLRLELLESTLLEDFDSAVKVINDLRAMGIGVALDDFGAGYSSLEYVAKLPMDCLKIDRMFLLNLHKNPTNRIVLETIMTLAKGMGVKTLAEGVETKEHYDFLRDIGCDVAQGYFINKPIDATAFEAFLLNYK
jgi:diguanylate cyclase (GGDEF)-like protein